MRWLLVPFGLLGAAVAGLFARKTRRTADEVAKYLRDFIEGRGGEWDWDDFESVPIADAELDSIRRRAAQAGPPNPDVARLAALLSEAETLAATTASQGRKAMAP